MKKLILLLALLVSGCQYLGPPEDIPFTTILQREYTDSFLSPDYNLLVKDDCSWDEIWDFLTYSRIVPMSDYEGRLPGELPLPDIDFDDYWVIVSVGASRVENAWTEIRSFTEIRSVQVTGRRLVTTVFSGPPSAFDEEQVRKAEPRRPDGRYMPGFGPIDSVKYFHVVRIPRLDDNLQPEWLNLTIRRREAQ